MNRDEYRAAFDQVKFSEDFVRDTANKLLAETGQRAEKENNAMETKRIIKMPFIAAALAAVLLASAAAATLFLRPADVARHTGNEALAAAFESSDAVLIDQTQDSGDYRFYLAGLVSGAGLSTLCENANEDTTYVVASVSRLDGQPMDLEAGIDFALTPLVAGHTPWVTNAWTLGCGFTWFNQDGVTYYLYEYDSLAQFAGETIYFAAYEGFSPSAEVFQMAEDGSISYTSTFDAPHALFTMPALD